MNGKDLFLGLNYVNGKYIEEAETVKKLNGEKRSLTLKRPVLVAAIVALMLFLMGCAVVGLVRLQVKTLPADTIQGETQAREEVHFEKTQDVFMELGAYYPQQLPEGYTMTFVSEGAPLQHQRIVYENEEGKIMDYLIMIGDPASNVQLVDFINKEEVTVQGDPGILYTYGDGSTTLVWINQEQGFGFVLWAEDPAVDLLAVAQSTGAGEPLTTTRANSTVKALEELGDYSPTVLPEGYEEQGVMGSPLEEGGGWYSYVRKYYVNKEENTSIYFEYESYAIDTEAGYVDDAKTACSLFIPGSNALDGVVIGEEGEINGMFALITGNHIAWADPQRHVAYHLTSEDVLGDDLLEIARSIQLSK